jgi:hypothetical protein
MIVVFVVLPSAAELEVLHRLAETLEGVEAVEPLTMVRMHAFAEAFDRELALLTDGAGRTRPTVRRAKLA